MRNIANAVFSRFTLTKLLNWLMQLLLLHPIQTPAAISYGVSVRRPTLRAIIASQAKAANPAPA
jgi:hypothetical protein